MKKTYDILVTEEYESGGEKKTKFHNVGTAWPLDNKDGFSVQIHPGVAVSDRLVILPRKPREDGQEAS